MNVWMLFSFQYLNIENSTFDKQSSWHLVFWIHEIKKAASKCSTYRLPLLGQRYCVANLISKVTSIYISWAFNFPISFWEKCYSETMIMNYVLLFHEKNLQFLTLYASYLHLGNGTSLISSKTKEFAISETFWLDFLRKEHT